MSKMELLGALEAKELTNQNLKQYCGTPYTFSSNTIFVNGSIYNFYHCIMTVESPRTLRLNSLGIGGGINAICHNLKDLGTGVSPRFSPGTFEL